MNADKILESIEGKQINFDKFKVQVTNLHMAYLSHYTIAIKNLQEVTYPEDGEVSGLEESSIYVGVNRAAIIMSDVGLKLNCEEITERFLCEDQQYYTLYPYLSIWNNISNLKPEYFFIAILSLIINIEDFRKLFKFYNTDILRLLKDIDCKDIYDDLVKRDTVFIAMWFDSSMHHVRNSIEDTIRSCGYTASIIDKKEHNNQIVPEIFYEIDKSAFVIADLTGQRKGVYYEAGYAEALKKNVIITCKKEELKDCHFDIAQKNIILWEDAEDLSRRLFNRIRATCPIL